VYGEFFNYFNQGIFLQAAGKKDAVFTVIIELFVIQVSPVENVKDTFFFNNQPIHLGFIRHFGGSNYGCIGEYSLFKQPQS